MNDYEKQELICEQFTGPYTCAYAAVAIITGISCLCAGIMIGIMCF